MFNPDDILYEDNHLLIVNKRCGDLVQPDPSGESALEDQIKAFIKGRDAKPGEVFPVVVVVAQVYDDLALHIDVDVVVDLAAGEKACEPKPREYVAEVFHIIRCVS